jgi:predicted nucleic acid-binding protein
MRVLVDTPVWSLAFRRIAGDGQALLANQPYIDALKDLVLEGRAFLVGPVRQELLSGIRSAKQFESLRKTLDAYPEIVVSKAVFEQAAMFSNTCRAKGIQGSPTDYLLCALAVEHGCAIFTLDQDFSNYRKHLPIVLFDGGINIGASH